MTKPNDSKIKVAMLITTLTDGGAEHYLLRTLENLDRSNFKVMVLALGPMGEVGLQIQKLGITVIAADVSSNVGFGTKWIWALSQLSRFRPDVCHAWMYHAMAWSIPINFLLKSRTIWSIRNGQLNQGSLPKTTLMLAKYLEKYSSKVNTIIYNSTVAQSVHERLGYDVEKSVLIHNGFDLPKYDPSERELIRERSLKDHGLNTQDHYIGFVSRHHPQKDIETFLRVTENLRQLNVPVKIITCGRGLGPQDAHFGAELKRHDLEEYVIPLGVVENMAHLYPCFDALLLTSKEESLPNVIGEAMAQGVICVSTRVGDVDRLLHSEQLCDVGEAIGLAQVLIQHLNASAAEKQVVIERQQDTLAKNFDIKIQQEMLEDLYQ